MVKTANRKISPILDQKCYKLIFALHQYFGQINTGFVQQEPVLFNRTITENITYGTGNNQGCSNITYYMLIYYGVC